MLYCVYEERHRMIDRANSGELSQFLLVGVNEFKRVAGHPVAILLMCIFIVLAFVQSAAGCRMLQIMEFHDPDGPDRFVTGFAQMWYETSLICSVMAAFIGIVSILEDRSKSLFNVLLVKPLYRRDVIIGKFIGISVFITIFIAISIAIYSLLLMLFFRMPLSMTEFLSRISVYILGLSMECSLTIVLAMLFGIVFENFLESLGLLIAYFYLDWYCDLGSLLGTISLINPHTLYSNVVSFYLFDTTFPFLQVVNNSLPYAILMLAEISVLLLLDCLIFTRYGD